MENKREFIKALGVALRDYSRENVDYIDYVMNDCGEYAVITFKNGHREQVNITGDSCAAIFHEIYRVLVLLGL